jgi:hypothetical protein
VLGHPVLHDRRGGLEVRGGDPGGGLCLRLRRDFGGRADRPRLLGVEVAADRERDQKRDESEAFEGHRTGIDTSPHPLESVK